jgi:hypothetical protein
VKYRILNILEKRQPLSLSCTQDAIRAEFETALDAHLTYRNLIAKVPDGETLLNTNTNTVEVFLGEKCESLSKVEPPSGAEGLRDTHTRAIAKRGKSYEDKINGKDNTSLDRFDSGGMFGIHGQLLVNERCPRGNG